MNLKQLVNKYLNEVKIDIPRENTYPQSRDNGGIYFYGVFPNSKNFLDLSKANSIRAYVNGEEYNWSFKLNSLVKILPLGGVVVNATIGKDSPRLYIIYQEPLGQKVDFEISPFGEKKD